MTNRQTNGDQQMKSITFKLHGEYLGRVNLDGRDLTLAEARAKLIKMNRIAGNDHIVEKLKSPHGSVTVVNDHDIRDEYSKPDNGPIYPACGGTEEPFTVNGTTWLYVWQPSSGCHGYLNMTTDVVEWNSEFSPELG
jgi:hypothetical protein